MADYRETFDSRDPGLMSGLYQENGIVIWGDRIWRGRGEIQDFYQEMFERIFPPDMQFERNIGMVIEGGIAYVVWSGASPLQEVSLGVDTFVVQGGAIQCLTLYMEGDV
ncbi:MAG: nuclear transport factor 2 family protein [Spirulina sp. SIO3F2]|nr:nuclear transport factor 2 family protein [Spirulina sp. SIO3F2]